MKIIKVHKHSPLFLNAIDLLVFEYDFKNRGKKYWINRFTKSNDLDYIGYLLEIENNFCGFLGVIGSPSMIGLSVWYVNSKYRNFSLQFLINTLSLINSLTVNSSANTIAFNVFKKLGYVAYNEYIGFPKLLFGWIKSSDLKIYRGDKYICLYDKNISLIQLLIIMIRLRKIVFFLSDEYSNMFLIKRIPVLINGGIYSFPMSIYGDRFE
jgi:hypothetical protein